MGGEGAPARPLVLAQLAAEREHALGAYETGRAAEIEAQMIRLSAGSAGNPSRETTARRPAARARRKTSGQLAAGRD